MLWQSKSNTKLRPVELVTLTDLKKRLIWVLVNMVRQNCSFEVEGSMGVYSADYLSAHKNAMRLLVEVKVMEEAYPDEKFRDRWERLYYAKFIPGWELKLRDRNLFLPPPWRVHVGSGKIQLFFARPADFRFWQMRPLRRANLSRSLGLMNSTSAVQTPSSNHRTLLPAR